jgi:hypothetical protein
MKRRPVRITETRDPEVLPDGAHVVHALRYLREIGKRILREEREANDGDGKTDTPNENQIDRRRD